jgi:hypothetical protein
LRGVRCRSQPDFLLPCLIFVSLLRRDLQLGAIVCVAGGYGGLLRSPVQMRAETDGSSPPPSSGAPPPTSQQYLHLRNTLYHMKEGETKSLCFLPGRVTRPIYCDNWPILLRAVDFFRYLHYWFFYCRKVRTRLLFRRSWLSGRFSEQKCLVDINYSPAPIGLLFSFWFFVLTRVCCAGRGD